MLMIDMIARTVMTDAMKLLWLSLLRLIVMLLLAVAATMTSNPAAVVTDGGDDDDGYGGLMVMMPMMMKTIMTMMMMMMMSMGGSRSFPIKDGPPALPDGRLLHIPGGAVQGTIAENPEPQTVSTHGRFTRCALHHKARVDLLNRRNPNSTHTERRHLNSLMPKQTPNPDRLHPKAGRKLLKPKALTPDSLRVSSIKPEIIKDQPMLKV